MINLVVEIGPKAENLRVKKGDVLGDDRYAYNGMEVDNEVSGNGNSYTTFFRQYDPRLGRWKSRDPKVLPAETPYMSMGNNPIYFNDPLGDIVKGYDKASAKMLLNDLQRTFSGTGLSHLFKLQSDGKTFEKISANDMANALDQMINQDLRDLAYSYYLAINDVQTHEVYFIDMDQSTAFDMEVGKGKIISDGVSLSKFAGRGINASAKGKGSFTHVLKSPTAHTTRRQTIYDDDHMERSETVAHEMLGHGYNGAHGSSDFSNQDAIQMSNLYRRSQGSSIFRTGSDHGGVVGNPLGLPSLFLDVVRFIRENKADYQHIAKGTQWHVKFDANQKVATEGKYFKVTNVKTGNDLEVFKGDDGEWHFKGGPKDKDK